MKWLKLYKESKDSDFKIENGVLKKYIGHDSDVIIPRGVKKIGRFSFWRSGISSVTIPNGVVEIEDHAFAECEYLWKVTIPNTVTNIGDGAFMNCFNLSNITLPKKLTFLGGAAF